MVIDKGRQAYFGPTTEGYFQRTGFKEKSRQTSLDYLAGCADSLERESKEGRSKTLTHLHLTRGTKPSVILFLVLS